MHVKGFLHKMFSPVMHNKRFETLFLTVTALLKNKKLSVTELGRGMRLPIQERSGIRRADRFLSNDKLHAERFDILKALAKEVVGNQSRPCIIVDWSDVPNTFNCVLRAAYIADGRAITLYEKVHPLKKLSNPAVEKKFLKALKLLLPKRCKPIIITDAGFHNKWFKEVLSLGWDYIGRVRCGKKCSFDNGRTWKKYTELFNKASTKPKSLGSVLLCSTNKMETNLYLFKEKFKNRSLLNKYGKKRSGTGSLDYRKAAKEAWVIASSMFGRLMAKRVIKIYKSRMQIEEGFRDLKSSKTGFGFEHAYSKKIDRIEILLLISAIASFIAWIIGWAAEKNNLHFQFQSNTIKKRRVLSLFYLGCQIIKRNIKISPNDLKLATQAGITQNV